MCFGVLFEEKPVFEEKILVCKDCGLEIAKIRIKREG